MLLQAKFAGRLAELILEANAVTFGWNANRIRDQVISKVTSGSWRRASKFNRRRSTLVIRYRYVTIYSFAGSCQCLSVSIPTDQFRPGGVPPYRSSPRRNVTPAVCHQVDFGARGWKIEPARFFKRYRYGYGTLRYLALVGSMSYDLETPPECCTNEHMSRLGLEGR
jgi:hypothetical protein